MKGSKGDLKSLFLICLFAQQLCGGDPPSGRVVWWGNNPFEYPAKSGHSNGVVEYDNEILTNVVAVVPGTWESLALKSDGTVFPFGRNTTGPFTVPAGLSNVVSIAKEEESYFAIRRDGTVAQWGNARDDAHAAAGLSNVTAIVWAGRRYYLALKNDGTLLGFRFHQGGFTNQPPKESAIRPVKVCGQLVSNVVALASGGYTPFVLKSDGTVFILGYQTPGVPPVQPRWEVHDNHLYEYLGGESAQLPYEYSSADPIMVGGKNLSHVVAIASSKGRILALKSDGTVVASDDDSQPEPAVPAGLSNVTAIAVDGNVSLALKRDGTVTAWGDNSSGQSSVPAGLSNVVAIATGGGINMAITTGNVPGSVYIQPHGRFEEMDTVSDLVFKGQVLSTTPISNPAFQFPQMEVNATIFKVISVLKGKAAGHPVVFEHYNSWNPGRLAWGGPRPNLPACLNFEEGQTYLVFAANLDKPDKFYAPSPDIAKYPSDQFRQLSAGGVMRTLDARPLNGLTIKDAHWFELNLLLNDANPANTLYAMDELDQLGDVFKHKAVLDALLPLLTNKNEPLADRAISCFETDPNSVAQMESFRAALATVANNGPSSLTRLVAIKALSGMDGDAVSNSLAALLKFPDEKIRISAVTLLPRFPPEFAETALRERAGDESPYVRSVVADVIGEGKYARVLPTLAKLFTDSSGPVPEINPLPAEALPPDSRANGAGNVHTSAARALVKFDLDQVADILKTNLNDAAFRVDFIAKLAEKDAEPWLPELSDILESKVKEIGDFSKLPADDPRRISDVKGEGVLTDSYGDCWEDVRHYLLNLPKEKFTNSDTVRYTDLLERTIQTNQFGGVNEAVKLYELYRTKALDLRAEGLRRKYDGERAWFDNFDEYHPELMGDKANPAAQYLLALEYLSGDDVPRNPAEATKWFRKAADQGYAEAQFELGLSYIEGRGISQDFAEAAKWFRKAADQSYAAAQFNLGSCYERGDGVAQDFAEAVNWYLKAAQQGFAEAQINLGTCYQYGKGVSEDRVEAVKWYRKAAEHGHSAAQFNLGVCYQNGDGVTQDFAEAVNWYQKAAQQGHAFAQFCLGLAYNKGRGVAQDSAQAVNWYQKAAQQGYAEAQFNLGFCYEKGDGVTQDYAEAMNWYRKAAQQGLGAAQNQIGYCYHEAKGVPKDRTEAVNWYRKSAEQGYALGQYSLGIEYANGDGVVKDDVQAYKWGSLASAQSLAMANQFLHMLKRRMSQEQIAEAQRLAREFKPDKKTQ